MQKGNFFGINFGTTNTAVVHLQSEEQGVRLAHLGEGGDYPFSSIVAVPKEGGLLKFGREVRKRREELSDEYEIFASMKSYLGTKKEFIAGTRRYTAAELTAEFLKSVKAYILMKHREDIKEAGFAFPIDFSPEARRDLCKAAELAGISVKCFISESTAAYLASRQDVQAYSRVMVLDWGGGTFDISILDLKKNSVTEAAVYGDKIGGDDIDIELARRVHAEIVKKSKSALRLAFDDMKPHERDLMIARCELAKINISDSDVDYDFSILNYGGFGHQTLTIDVDWFNRLVEPVIKRRILGAIDAALSRANLTPAGIDAIIIIGGSSNLSSYERAITNKFGADKIILPEKRQWSTAEGAALMQIIGGDFKLKDALGVLLSDGSVLSIFEANEDGVGTRAGPITFSIVEENSHDARFIFVNKDDVGASNITYAKKAVPAKGFLMENISLSAEIGIDQIARINISSSFMGKAPPVTVEINKLAFFYDTSNLN